MKYTISLLFLCFILTAFSSCEKEEITPEIQVAPKLSRITINGQDDTRYYYENDKLIEIQTEVYKYDEELDSSWYQTYSQFLEYENDKLSRIVSGGAEKLFTYSEGDMTISKFHWNYPEGKMIFKNYEDLNNMSFHIYYSDDWESFVNPHFDSSNNFLNADEDDGSRLFDNFPGQYYLSQYYGNYTYFDKLHHASNLDREIQLYLFQKPFNNCVKEIDRVHSIIDYKYEFNADNYPISSEATTTSKTNGNSNYHGKREYFYE